MSNLRHRFEKIIKRNIRESRKFKRGVKLDIYTINSCSFNVFQEVFNKINSKNKLNINLDIKKHNDPINLWNSIKNLENTLIFVPNEVIISMFILDISKLFPNKLYYFKNKQYINLGYGISEYYICRHMNKEYLYFFRKFLEVEKLVIDSISKDEKYIKAPLRSIEFILKNTQKWQDSS